MVLVADEGVDRQIVDREAVLVTSDKDFGELVFRRRLIHKGVILLRLPGMDPDDKAAVVASDIGAHESEMLSGFSVIGPSSVRIRSVPS